MKTDNLQDLIGNIDVRIHKILKKLPCVILFKNSKYFYEHHVSINEHPAYK